MSVILNFMSTEEACAEVIGRERQLLEPEVRRQPDLVRALHHPEFVEFGASGRIWNAESIINALTSEQAPHEIAATDFLALRLSPDVILLTFKTDSAECAGSAKFHSDWLWCNFTADWQMLSLTNTNVSNRDGTYAVSFSKSRACPGTHMATAPKVDSNHGW